MADGFDSEEILHEMIQSVGVPVYKGPAPLNLETEHIVIRAIVTTSLDVVNVIPVAINIYVPKPDNGMVNRDRLKAIRTLVRGLIANGSSPEGYYCVIDPAFSQIMEEAKKGFDCFTMRYELTQNQ